MGTLLKDFDPAADYVWRRDILFAGVKLKAGDSVDKSAMAQRKLADFFKSRLISLVEQPAETASAPVLEPKRPEVLEALPAEEADAALLSAMAGMPVPEWNELSDEEREEVVLEVLTEGQPQDNNFLLGSSLLPSTFDFGGDDPVQLGEIVVAAHEKSGLSIEAWNNHQFDDERELLLNAEVASRVPAKDDEPEMGE